MIRRRGPCSVCIRSADWRGATAVWRHIWTAHPCTVCRRSGSTRFPARSPELAARYVDRIRAVQPDGPYHLLGWSAGGTIAHEMAVQLREAGQRVALLALLDTFTPETMPDVTEPAYGEVEIDTGGLPDDLVARVRRRADTAAVTVETGLRHHTPPRVHDGAVHLFVAESERRDSAALVAAWSRYTTGDVVDHPLPFAHSDLTVPEALRRIGPVLVQHGGISQQLPPIRAHRA